MAKKVSDEQCVANYNAMCDLFREVVPNSGRFTIIYGYGVDVGMMNFVVLSSTTYTYSSYAIGFDAAVNGIAVLPIDRDLSAHGEPIYLKKDEIKKAKRHFNGEYIIQSPTLPKKYISFSVSEQINQDPEEICLCVKQDEQAKRFLAFFKQQYAK